MLHIGGRDNIYNMGYIANIIYVGGRGVCIVYLIWVFIVI